MCTYQARVCAGALWTGWVLCTLLAVCGALSAVAADRAVLCEEFTNRY